MNAYELKDIIELHRKWLFGESGGVKANFRGANLQEANFQEANFQWANFQDANLRLANFRGADLRGANLQGANFQGADLRLANFQDADLRLANFQEANLQEANLRGANFRGANLQGAKWGVGKCSRPLFLGPIGSRNDYARFQIINGELMVYTGCFSGDFESFIKKVESVHGDNEHGRAYLSAAKFAKEYHGIK